MKKRVKDDTAVKSAVPAVEKAFDILELLADAPNGMTISEMVTALGRTVGEVYRIVVYMSERDYLVQHQESGRYALTLRLFELAHRHDPTQRLIRCALPILERLAATMEQSCHLGVLNRDNVLVLASVPSPRPAGYSVRHGAVFPVRLTSSGHVILAFSDEVWQKRHTARLPAQQRQVARTRLQRIRANGYEDVASKMVDGVRNLCAPVFDARGIAAAITCGFIGQTEQQASPAQVLAAVRDAARELSRALGHRAPMIA